MSSPTLRRTYLNDTNSFCAVFGDYMLRECRLNASDPIKRPIWTIVVMEKIKYYT